MSLLIKPPAVSKYRGLSSHGAVMMRAASLARRASAAALRPAFVTVCVALLAGCGYRAGNGNAPSAGDIPPPQEQVADYRIARCDLLWQVDDPGAASNGLYWLRAMDCAERMLPLQARETARSLPADTWVNAFRQGILLDNADIVQGERRQIVQAIERYRGDFPASVRPLLLIWLERQTLLFSLADERLRYRQLQESSDKQLDSLRIRHGQLQQRLDATSRKLENLTDIERELSNRKSLTGDAPESGLSAPTPDSADGGK